MNIKAGALKEIELVIEAFPREGMSLDELELKMKQLGNTVLERRTHSLVLAYQKQKVNE